MAQYLGLIIFLLPSYLIRFTIKGVPFTLLEVLVLGAIGWFVVRGGIKKLLAEKNVRLWLWLGVAWMLVGTVALFVSPDLRAAAGVWKAYIIEPTLLFFVFLIELHVEQTRRWVYYGLACLAAALGGLLAFQWLTGIGIHAPWDHIVPRRATGPFGYPNANALLLAPIAVLLGGLAWLEKKLSRRDRIFFAASALIASAGIFFVHSAGGMVGLAAGISFLLVIPSQTRRWAGVFIAFGGLVLALWPKLRVEVLFQDWSGKVHWWNWQETILMLRDHWFLGAGLAGYQQVFAPYHARQYIEIFMYPHNIFLNFWSEMGLAGLVLFLVVVFFAFRNGFDRNSQFAIRNSPAIAALAALLIHGLVDVPFFKNDLAIVFWLIIALAVVSTPEKKDSILKV